MEPYQHRVCNIPLTEEQHESLRKLIPYGLQGKIFKFLVDDLIEALEKDPAPLIAGIVSREIKLRDIMRLGGDKDNG